MVPLQGPGSSRSPRQRHEPLETVETVDRSRHGGRRLPSYCRYRQVSPALVGATPQMKVDVVDVANRVGVASRVPVCVVLLHGDRKQGADHPRIQSALDAGRVPPEKGEIAIPPKVLCTKDRDEQRQAARKAFMGADCQAPGNGPGRRTRCRCSTRSSRGQPPPPPSLGGPQWPRLEIMKPRRTAIATPIAVHLDLSGLST
jgi:hypothetical protein